MQAHRESPPYITPRRNPWAQLKPLRNIRLRYEHWVFGKHSQSIVSFFVSFFLPSLVPSLIQPPPPPSNPNLLGSSSPWIIVIGLRCCKEEPNTQPHSRNEHSYSWLVERQPGSCKSRSRRERCLLPPTYLGHHHRVCAQHWRPEAHPLRCGLPEPNNQVCRALWAKEKKKKRRKEKQSKGHRIYLPMQRHARTQAQKHKHKHTTNNIIFNHAVAVPKAQTGAPSPWTCRCPRARNAAAPRASTQTSTRPASPPFAPRASPPRSMSSRSSTRAYRSRPPSRSGLRCPPVSSRVSRPATHAGPSPSRPSSSTRPTPPAGVPLSGTRAVLLPRRRGCPPGSCPRKKVGLGLPRLRTARGGSRLLRRQKVAARAAKVLRGLVKREPRPGATPRALRVLLPSLGLALTRPKPEPNPEPRPKVKPELKPVLVQVVPKLDRLLELDLPPAQDLTWLKAPLPLALVELHPLLLLGHLIQVRISQFWPPISSR
jgi:hypothetical protein